MQELVDQTSHQLPHPLRIVCAEIGQVLQGPGQFPLADGVEALAQSLDRGSDCKGIVPPVVSGDVLLDDALRLQGFVLAFPPVGVDHRIEVVNVVEVDIGQGIYFGVNIPRHGDIDIEHRRVLPFAHRFPGPVLGDDMLAGAGGADHNIRLGQRGIELIEGESLTLVLLGQCNSVGKCPVGDHQSPDSLLDEMVDGQLGHVTRTDHQNDFVVQGVKDLGGQFHGGITDRYRVAGDLGFRAYPLGRAKNPGHQPG